MEDIWSRYNDDPSDWIFLEVDTDRDDRVKIYFSDGEDTWYVDGFVTSNDIKGKGTIFEGRDIKDFVGEKDFGPKSGVRLLNKERLVELIQKGDFSEEKLLEMMNQDPSTVQNVEEDEDNLGIIGPNYIISKDELRLSNSERKKLRELRRLVDNYENKQLRYIG